MAADFVADFALDITLTTILFFVVQALMHITIGIYADSVDKPRHETHPFSLEQRMP